MPRKRWIDKHHAQTYQLLYRSQNDPLLNDETAGERALFPVAGKGSALPSSSRPQATYAEGLHLADLEDGLDFESMRENEGEAAGYGIFFDDTEYDYMQHLREIGGGTGESHFVGPVSTKATPRGKGKGKEKIGNRVVALEDALRATSLEEHDHDYEPDTQSMTSASVMSAYSSRSVNRPTYASQQEVPDEIAGFQPDMDPRLREALEALENDAYVDEADEDDIFGQLTKTGRINELTLDEFEQSLGEEVGGDQDDEGWESDVTEKPSVSVQEKELKLPSSHIESASASLTAPRISQGESNSTAPSEKGREQALQTDLPSSTEAATGEDGAWLADFTRYKRDISAAASKQNPSAAAQQPAPPSVFSAQSRTSTLYTLNGTPLRRQKKRKGALTNPSTYSMTSSSLARTDGQQLLDRQFERIEKLYALDEDEDEELDELDTDMDGGVSVSGASAVSKQSRMSNMSTLSTASFADRGAVRADFDSMVDEFLGGGRGSAISSAAADDSGENSGRRTRGKKSKHGNRNDKSCGLAQLDEVRAQLGRGRVYRRQKSPVS